MNRNRPTKLKKMKLNSVDFVRRGANPAADIALYKSADYLCDPEEDEKQSFFKSIADGIASGLKKAFSFEEETDDTSIDVAKADYDLQLFTDALGESFSSIMKDNSIDVEEKLGMVQKSLYEFNDTLDGYLSSFDTVEKSTYEATDNYFEELEKGDVEEMANFNFENVDKSLLTPNEAATLDALIAKACKTQKADYEEMMDKSCGGKMKKAGTPAVNTGATGEEDELPPEVKKALQEVEDLKKSYEMKELETIAKKYEILGKKASEEAQTLYNLKKSGEENYNAYVAAMDAQVDLVEKSGLFAEIGKSGNFNYQSVAKSEPETKVETIAKSYMEADPKLDYNSAIAKAWANNPELMAAYEEEAGF